jgi:galactokinase/mevalonate kinase-like predicted kinase
MGDQAFAVRGPDDLKHRNDPFDFLRALLRSLDVLPDCEIRAATDIPLRSGLAGSGALMLAASASLLTFIGKPASRKEILETAYRAEVDFLNNFCGWNDFYACIDGGVHAMNYREPVDGSPEVTSLALRDDHVSFAIAFTGDMHQSGQVNRRLWDRWRSGDAAVQTEYERLAELGPAARRAFESNDWPAFGKLMLENFRCQYRLQAANEIEDALVQEAMSLGAFGAKLCGAGHCGSIVILARNDDHAGIARGLEAVGVRQYFKVVPADGLTIKRG